MRISQNILTNTTLNNLNTNLETMLRIQEKLSTGRDITRPTDGPVRFSGALTLRTAIGANEQYKKNADFAITWLNTTDNAIQEGNSVLQRIRELTVRASSDTLSGDERNAIANEVDELAKQMRAVANADLNGRYLFAGNDTTREPYPNKGNVPFPDPASGPDTGNGTRMKLEIGQAVTIEFNSPGVNVFGRTLGEDVTSGNQPADPDNIFLVLSKLSTALRANDQKAVSDVLPQLDRRHQAFLTEQSVIGGKVSRLLLLKERLADQNVELSRFKSETEDADMSKLITDLNRQDSVYRASLAAGSRVIQPTLVDYLR